MVYTKQGAQKDAIVPTPPSTPTLREPLSRELHSGTRSSSIEARTARNAALDNAFSIDPTIKEIIYSNDNQEEKYDENSNNGNKDKDGEDNGDEEGSNDEDKDKNREDDKDEDDDAKDNNDDDDKFYKKRLLFDKDDDNSIGDAKHCVPLAKGAGAGHKPKICCPNKPNTDVMMPEQVAEKVLRK